MGAFLYRCPATGLNVQGRRAELSHAPGDDICEAVTCIACRGVHLVNAKTGRVIAETPMPSLGKGDTRSSCNTKHIIIQAALLGSM